MPTFRNQIGNLMNNSQVGAYTYPTSGAGVVRPHAVTAAGGNTYTYDNNGNLTGGAGRTYTWNLENKPLTVTQGGTTTTFVYDGDGGRVKKIVGSTTTRYISKLYECDNTNCSRFIWAGSTRIATVAASGTIHYWHGDHLGSSSVITDSTGAKAQTVTYYPYGATRTNQSFTTPAVDVPYKYTGKELDTTGLYYYEARYYDPALGRFISADTLVPRPNDPQEFNRYAYAGNNPLKYTDPSGHSKIKFTKFFKRAFGDLGTTALGLGIQIFGGPIFGAVNFVAGGAVLTQSKSGRYVVAGEIIAATIALYTVCPGCDGGQGVTIASSVGSTYATAVAAAKASSAALSATYAGAVVGSIATGTLGGYSAAQAGGDVSKGVLLGTGVGAVMGAIAGGLYPTPGLVTPGLAWQEQMGLAAAAGFTKGLGYGVADGFAGGKGSLGSVLMGSIAGSVSNAVTGGLGGAFDSSWQGVDRFMGATATPPNTTLSGFVANLRASDKGFTGLAIEYKIFQEPRNEVLQEIYGDKVGRFVKGEKGVTFP